MRHITMGIGLAILGIGIALHPLLSASEASATASSSTGSTVATQSAVPNGFSASCALAASRFGNGGCDVTWPIFDTSIVQLLESNSPSGCTPFAGGGWKPVDLDGDRVDELAFARSDFVASVFVIRSVRGVAQEDRALSWSDVQAPWIPADASRVTHFIDFADMTGDGLPDVVVRVDWNDAGTDRVMFGYLRNLLRPTSALVADLNRDGLVNGIDLSILLGSWGDSP